ncbi:MAG: hypothetical protein HYR63_06765 [Proteobacteria bacterium]|nr:hypothetical protein [Pseudomonadota bacterium]
MLRDKHPSAEAIRDEIVQHMHAIAASTSPGTTIKGKIRFVARHLAHPELSAATIKRLWYREIRVIPAHIVDYIRERSRPKQTTRFVIDPQGVIRQWHGSGAEPTAVRIRIERAHVVVEISPSRVSRGGLGMLRQYLLTLMLDQRPIRLVNLDRNKPSDVSSAVAALEALEEMMSDISLQTAAIQPCYPIIAGPAGIQSFDRAAQNRYDVTAVMDDATARYLARTHAIVVFMQGGSHLTVYAAAGDSRSEAATHAMAWLTAQAGPIEMRVWWVDAWLNDRDATGAGAALRLESLMRLKWPTEPPPTYVGERVPLDDVAEAELQPYRPLLALAGTTFDRSAFDALVASDRIDRLTIATVAVSETRRLYVGTGHDYYGPTWWLECIGTPLGDQPDPVYGAAVEARYCAAAMENAMHFERVHARIRESSGHFRRSCYTRLIMPFDQRDSSLCVGYTVLSGPDRARM